MHAWNAGTRGGVLVGPSSEASLEAGIGSVLSVLAAGSCAISGREPGTCGAGREPGTCGAIGANTSSSDVNYSRSKHH